jgi:hypothetical protein
MRAFDVTYEIVTPESAAFGDVDSQGYVSRGVRLREAIEDVRDTRTSRGEGVEAIEPSSSGGDYRWINVTNGPQFDTGAQETRTLHLPDDITSASRARILRLVGAAEMAALTLSRITRMGVDSLPYYGTYARLNLPRGATMDEVEKAARRKLQSGHETPDAHKFYAIMKRWHEHRLAGRII